MYYSEYTSKAQRERKAANDINRIMKKTPNIKPIRSFKGAIANTFWGKSWCKNLETYADYNNRLPRGRSYVRSGCVCHLALENGKIIAKISGSSVYTVTVTVSPLEKNVWQKLCKDCAGQTGSLLELLQGKLSQHVMQHVCAPKTGLFPRENDIHLHCSCPDSAYLCKHVAAALYGIGRLLDTEPELLFTLRGVSPEDLMGEQLQFSPNLLETQMNQDLAALFGIDLTLEPLAPPTQQAQNQNKNTKCTLINGKIITGTDICELRAKCDLSVADFANMLGVTAPTVKRWEAQEQKNLAIRSVPRQHLEALYKAIIKH